MERYYYALVRCVPNPRTGEFVNIGAIAGNPETGDWSIRELGNEKRVRSLAEPEDIAAAHEFMARVGFEMDSNSDSMESGDAEPLTEQWLLELHYNYRNVVQLSKPVPIISDSADSALALIFEKFLIDPVQPHRRLITKHRAVSALIAAYRRARIDPRHVKRGVDVIVGDHLTAKLDFAIGNGRAVQLSQGWSFQVTRTEEISTQVKSWAYALSRLRAGEDARVFETRTGVGMGSSLVAPDVDLEVVVVLPKTPEQERIYDEAQQVFQELNVSLRGIDNADEVATRAAELMRAQSEN